MIVVFGDHQPRVESELYEEAAGVPGSRISDENWLMRYETPFIIWSNYDLDTSIMPDEAVSTFYTPYLIMEMIDAPRDSFTQAMMDEMETEPVYSTNYMPMQESNEMLDTLTYDRILGDILSPSALPELYADEATETTE